MTAPDRIWANVAVWGNGEPLAGEWNYRDVGLADDTEYLRADGPTITAYREALRTMGIDPDSIAKEATK